MSLSKRLWNLARANVTDFTGALRSTGEDHVPVDTEVDAHAGEGGSVGARAGDAARRFKTRAERAWEQAYEAAKAGQHIRRGAHSEDEIGRWYETLELQRGASPGEIRRAYRRLINQYHPDRYANDPEKLRAATEVARKLTDAYNGLREHQGQ